MLPLRQPKSQDPSQSAQGPVKTKIPFTLKERRQALPYYKSETANTQKMDDYEQDLARDQPRCRLLG